MKHVVWLLIVLLIVLHQDFWFWDDDRLLFGFLPIGMVYHMGLSVAAAVTWWLATQFAWPDDEAGAPIESSESPGTEGSDA